MSGTRSSALSGPGTAPQAASRARGDRRDTSGRPVDGLGRFVAGRPCPRARCRAGGSSSVARVSAAPSLLHQSPSAARGGRLRRSAARGRRGSPRAAGRVRPGRPPVAARQGSITRRRVQCAACSAVPERRRRRSGEGSGVAQPADRRGSRRRDTPTLRPLQSCCVRVDTGKFDSSKRSVFPCLRATLPDGAGAGRGHQPRTGQELGGTRFRGPTGRCAGLKTGVPAVARASRGSAERRFRCGAPSAYRRPDQASAGAPVPEVCGVIERVRASNSLWQNPRGVRPAMHPARTTPLRPPTGRTGVLRCVSVEIHPVFLPHAPRGVLRCVSVEIRTRASPPPGELADLGAHVSFTTGC